jgi:uncharacterized RDD family membrane protein YckC
VRYEDRITIQTPEGVDLDLTLAGLGSRFAARIIDELIKLAIIVALFAGVASLGASAGVSSELGGDNPMSDTVLVAVAVVVVIVFLVSFFYEVLFETLASGRTPGKRATGLRVVRLDGRPVNFTASAVRNLLRVIDSLPFAYVAGMVCILVTPRNQRLGDLAAGTLVAREMKGAPAGAQGEVGTRPETASRTAPSWDVTAITAEEAAAVRRFLERREGLQRDARARLASQFAARLGPKVAGASDDLGAEEFLEGLAAAKSARS